MSYIRIGMNSAGVGCCGAVSRGELYSRRSQSCSCHGSGYIGEAHHIQSGGNEHDDGRIEDQVTQNRPLRIRRNLHCRHLLNDDDLAIGMGVGAQTIRI